MPSEIDWRDMIKTAKDLVLYLANDAKFMAYFMANPKKIISELSVPGDEKKVLQSGDPAAINSMLSNYFPRGESPCDGTLEPLGIFNCTN